MSESGADAAVARERRRWRSEARRRRLPKVAWLAGLAVLVASVAAFSALWLSRDPAPQPPVAVQSERVVPPVQSITPEQAPRVADGPRPMWASTPTEVRIPAIGVNTPLMALGLLADGSLETPPNGFPAGWYTGAPTPGEYGTALVAGHVDWTGPAVFHDLGLLVPGDRVIVVREDGSTATFEVRSVRLIPKDELPKDEIFGDHAGSRLALITCGGVFDEETRHYLDNVLVLAELVDSTSPV